MLAAATVSDLVHHRFVQLVYPAGIGPDVAFSAPTQSGQRGAGDSNAGAGVNLALAIQRQMVIVPGNDDAGDDDTSEAFVHVAMINLTLRRLHGKRLKHALRTGREKKRLKLIPPGDAGNNPQVGTYPVR